jgi:hypothetical protein
MMNFEPDISQSYAYHSILPLKLILLKHSDPDRFALMDRLMDHKQHREKVKKSKITSFGRIFFLYSSKVT